MFARCPTCHSSSPVALALLRVPIVKLIFAARTSLPPLAITIDPDYSPAHTAKGDVLLLKGRYREAIDFYGRAQMLFPSSIQPGLALAYAYTGEAEQAIAYADKAMRLSPHDPQPLLYLAKALGFGILQDYGEALVWIKRTEAAAPEMQITEFVRSALLALAGQEADARATMQRYLASDHAPVRTHTQWKALWPAVPSPTDNPRLNMWVQKFNEGLRKAGLPE
jgi:tetratricopeptide (TPR) repeat protein